MNRLRQPAVFGAVIQQKRLVGFMLQSGSELEKSWPVTAIQSFSFYHARGSTPVGKPYNEGDGKARTSRRGSTIAHKVERRNDIAHFEAEVMHKASDGKTIAYAIKKASGKDIAKTVFVPIKSKAKLGVTIEPIIERIVEGIGNREQPMRWLGTPVRALDFATPISMLGATEGVEKVMDVLGQMEHGVW
ncbi:MAG: MbcA/ParS/Xre antitoxin family protein [Bryobacteraceae bacterium]